MQVTCYGITGELVKLERKSHIPTSGWVEDGKFIPVFQEDALTPQYEISIRDNVKRVIHICYGVKLEDVKFIGEGGVVW